MVPKRAPKGSMQVSAILEGIADALHLVAEAETAYRMGDHRAGESHAAADSAHCALLESICELSEEDADLVEPPFTEFETRLLRLPMISGTPEVGSW
jgi:hypothetical protein